MYNLSEFQAATTFLDMVVYLNNAAYQVPTSFFMVAIFFILLAGLKQYPIEHALVTSSWVCLILSLFLTLAGLLHFMFPLSFLIIAALTALYILKSGGNR